MGEVKCTVRYLWLRGLIAFGLTVATFMMTTGDAAADDRYVQCGYDSSTGTAYIQLLTGYELKGGPTGFYVRDNMDLTGCPVSGALEQVIYTSVGRGNLTLEVPGLFIGGTPEADGASEIEATIDLGPDSQLGLWGRNVGGDYFEISSTGEIRYTQDGDVDMTAALDGISLWEVTGGQGDDVVRISLGTGESVHVGGGGDNDNIQTAGSSDAVYASYGNDFVATGGGGDTLEGASGRDVLKAGSGNDILAGGGGRDTLYGGGGSDQISVLDGIRDVVKCGTGYDTVSADTIDAVGSDCEAVTFS